MAQLIANAVIAASGYAVIALGFSLASMTGGVFNFALGGLLVLGAYLALFFLQSMDALPLVAVVGSITLAAVVGLILEGGLFRPLRLQGARPLASMLVGLAVLIVIQNAISLWWGDHVRTLRTDRVVEGIAIMGGRITPVQLAILAVSLGLFLFTWLLLTRTEFGQQLRAVSSDSELARIIGVDSDRIIALTSVYAAALAATAGILIGLEFGMSPAMGFQAMLAAVVAVVLGGTGTVWGTALGALLIGFIRSASGSVLPTHWQETIIFATLLLFLLVKPGGILGQPPRKPRT